MTTRVIGHACFAKKYEHHVRMVAQLRRERMVAHEFADTSFLESRMGKLQDVRGNVPIIVVVLRSTTCCFILRHPGGPMSHDSSFDRLVSNQVFS